MELVYCGQTIRRLVGDFTGAVAASPALGQHGRDAGRALPPALAPTDTALLTEDGPSSSPSLKGGSRHVSSGRRLSRTPTTRIRPSSNCLPSASTLRQRFERAHKSPARRRVWSQSTRMHNPAFCVSRTTSTYVLLCARHSRPRTSFWRGVLCVLDRCVSRRVRPQGLISAVSLRRRRAAIFRGGP
jgi:hypothetical protein